MNATTAIAISLSDLSNKQSNIISLARSEAQNSQMLFKHGSIAVSNGRVLSSGHNHARNKIRNRTVCSFHSEIDVMSRLFRGTRQIDYRATSPLQPKVAVGDAESPSPQV